ncbi:LysR family transcriptional regulator [Hydrogenophaga luteola]|uniref:LysR family transcriptional regulator n=1 Tax=Hydrogenophaga luteola TaxID=1591122 RepID=A0ABV7VXZ9_9BURK
MGPGNRPLDMEWLEDFLALAETGNFSRAAKVRFIAQPALSRHIRSLEEWVGVDLFDRSAHPVALTPAGQRFRPLLEDVLSGLEAARIKARAAHDEAAAGLRFAATHLLSLVFFPGWFSRLEQTLGPRTVQMYSNNLEACEDLMLQRSVQFLLCYGHPEVPGRLEAAGYPVGLIGHDALVPLASTRTGGQPLWRLCAPADEEAPVLGYHASSGLGRVLGACLRPEAQQRLHDHTVFTSHHAVVLKAMTLEGRGVAWLPQSLVEAELQDGRLALAGDGDWSVPLEIRLYRQPAAMTAAAEALWTEVVSRSSSP